MRADPTFWILTRTSALTAYALLTLSVLAGLVLKSRPFRSLRASTVTDVHRVLASLALGAVAVHGTSLLFDSKLDFAVRDLVVLGEGPYRPLWTAFGIVAAELMAVVYVSFSLRRWTGVRFWRTLHWLTYGIFGAATVHGVMAGTDSPRPWATGLYVGAIGVVAAATCWRALAPPASARRPSGPGERRARAARAP